MMAGFGGLGDTCSDLWSDAEGFAARTLAYHCKLVLMTGFHECLYLRSSSSMVFGGRNEFRPRSILTERPPGSNVGFSSSPEQ